MILWTNWHFLAPNVYNPFEPLIFISYYLPDSEPGEPKYAKGSLVRSYFCSVCVFGEQVHLSLFLLSVGCALHSILCRRLVIRPPIPYDPRLDSFRP